MQDLLMDLERILTPREYEIVELMAHGCRQVDVAAMLGVSHQAISKHIKKIRQKVVAKMPEISTYKVEECKH